jgi:hypothetical protein
MAATEELIKLLDDIVQKKTLSLDALEGIQQLKKKAEQAEAELKVEQELHRKVRLDKGKLEVALEDWQAREKIVIDREHKLNEVEKERDVAQAKAEAIRECFGLVFRNVETRRQVLTNESVPMPSSGSGYYTAQQTKNEATTEGQG